LGVSAHALGGSERDMTLLNPLERLRCPLLGALGSSGTLMLGSLIRGLLIGASFVE
jgi:hypothetical protein